MEVRIKDNNGYVDADWTIEDGIMVVSPKKVKFEPKDGDLIHCANSICSYVAIFREMHNVYKSFYRYAVLINGVDLTVGMDRYSFSDYSNPRPATEQEKKLLFDKLKEKGYEWDAEKKEVVKLKWKPVLGEVYFRIEFVDHEFRYADWNWKNSTYEIKAYEKGWCFKTKEECQLFCDKLNQAIKAIRV